MNQAYQGTAEKPREANLNERLNKVSERLQFYCERVESVLSRVNGTPQAARGAESKLAQLTPTMPLANVVDHLEAVQNRLADLVTGIERIA